MQFGIKKLLFQQREVHVNIRIIMTGNYQIKNRNRYILEKWNFYFITFISFGFLILRLPYFSHGSQMAFLGRISHQCPFGAVSNPLSSPRPAPHRALCMFTLFLLKTIIKCNLHAHLFDFRNIPVFLQNIWYSWLGSAVGSGSEILKSLSVRYFLIKLCIMLTFTAVFCLLVHLHFYREQLRQTALFVTFKTFKPT